MNTTLRQHGFTLIELMVAVSVMAIMLLFTHTIFSETSRAVGQGVALSDAMNVGRAISQQLKDDADNMVAPSETDHAGLLLIANKTFHGVQSIHHRTGTRQPRAVRSDQLMFIRYAQPIGGVAPDASQIVPTVPANEMTTSPSTVVITDPPNHARVWYGHLEKLMTDGSDGPAIDTTIATHWLLGRHTLFLESPSAGITGVHAAAAQYNATINNSSAPGSVSKNVYMALADVANQKLADNTAAGGGAGGALIAYDPALVADVTYPLRTGQAHAGAGGYQEGMYSLAFLAERLRANPKPQWPSPEGSSYFARSWQIAQMHPILARNVSDFIVQFAADADNDGELDLNGNAIMWYDVNNQAPYDPATWNDGTSETDYDPENTAPAAPFATNADYAVAWRHDDDQAHGAGPNAPNDNSKWPYLIRVRFRVHDERGRLTSTVLEAGESGIWFEQIIRVNRPMP